MRQWMIAAAVVAIACPALAQALPPGPPPGVGSMTPAQAMQLYQSLSPDQKAAVRQAAEQARAQYGNDPAMKARVKAWLKSWHGQ
jgi:hypothetical protein